MGSAQCCSKVQSDEKNSELVIKAEETEKSSGKLKQSLEYNNQNIRSPIPKQKPIKPSNDEPATPGFAENKSLNSRRSEQSQKEIQLVGHIDLIHDPDREIKQEKESPLVSQKSIASKRRKNDSPVTVFEVKNSLRSYDTKKLEKLLSSVERSNSERRNNQYIGEEHEDQIEKSQQDNSSLRSNSIDNKSVKSILKQELKYSQFRKTKTNHDIDSQYRKVRFQEES